MGTYPISFRRVKTNAQNEYKISRDICTPEDRLDRFSRNAEATSWIEATKKMEDNLNYFSNDEESEWMANIDPGLLEKSNEEKQLDDSEISSFIEENRNSSTTKKTKTDLNVWTRGCNS